MSKKKANVSSVRKELADMLAKYELIGDALSGEQEVKSKKEKYLPKPNTNSSGSVAEDEARYNAYITRAVYYNMIKPTVDALVGQLFLRPPQVKLPTLLQGMEKDCNGEGLSLEQLVRKAANHVLPYGRAGLLADFPETVGTVSVQDVENGFIPFIRFYEPWSIINWRIQKINNKKKLVLLVLQEMVEQKGSEEFEVDVVKMYKVYRLEDNSVTLEIWNKEEVIKAKRTILDGEGNPLTEIPFEFVGSENNDSEMDEPPLYPMAIVNIAHYRNSADYEESVYLTGQPTPVYTGLTEDWVDNYFKGGIPFGSRASVPLPENADAKLLQASPNTLAFEAMTHKEEQMVALGAKLINPKQTVERKQAEIEIESASQRSVLTTIKDNLQMAFVACFKKASAFLKGIDTDEISVGLNDNFDLTSLTAEELRYLIELRVGNHIPFEAFHENLRRSGIVKITAEESKTAILKDLEFVKAITPEPTSKS